MRAAAILGLSASEKDLKPFQKESDVTWLIGLPASSGDADAILIFGGDGTVHRHLAQLVKLQLPVLVVPCGSGNDFARALNLRSTRDAVAAWRQFVSGRGSVRKIDLGVITPSDAGGAPAPHNPLPNASGNQKLETGNYFCCVGGVGLDVEVARLANRLPRALRRRGGYLLSLLPALFRFRSVAVEVGLARKFIERLRNSPQRAGNAGRVRQWSHFRRRPQDRSRRPTRRRKARSLHSLGHGKIPTASAFSSLYSGTHVKFREVKYFQAERLRIVAEPPSEVYADGEYVCSTPVDIKLERAALKVIVP